MAYFTDYARIRVHAYTSALNYWVSERTRSDSEIEPGVTDRQVFSAASLSLGTSAPTLMKWGGE